MTKAMNPAVTHAPRPEFGGDLTLLDHLSRASSRVAGTLLLWQSRAVHRAHLAEMESHRLEDLGISHAEAQREAVKPFWMA